MKRGQVTIFIILGILMVSVIGVLLLLRQSMLEFDPEDIPQSRASESVSIMLKEYMQNCLEDVSKITTEKLIFDGGQSRLKAFRDPPNSSFPKGKAFPLYELQGFDFYAPYVYRYDAENDRAFPLIYNSTQLASQLADAINLAMPYCLAGFEGFEEANLVINDTFALVNFKENLEIGVTYGIEGGFYSDNYYSDFPVVTYDFRSNLLFFNNFMKLIISRMQDENMNKNAFPEYYLASYAKKYNFTYQKVTIDDSKILLKLFKNSLSKGFENTVSVYNGIFIFDWDKEINPNFPIIDTKTLELGVDDNRVSYFNFWNFSWDVSNYDPIAGYEIYTIDSDFFVISGEGIILSKPTFPYLGVHDVVVRGSNLHNIHDSAFARFQINVVDEHRDIPYVKLIDKLYAFRGFPAYYRFMAKGTQDKQVFYTMELPDELDNMDCGGYLYLDLITGELTGFVTAPPGNYSVGITAFQFNGPDRNEDEIGYISFNTSFIVKGDYKVGCP